MKLKFLCRFIGCQFIIKDNKSHCDRCGIISDGTEIIKKSQYNFDLKFGKDYLIRKKIRTYFGTSDFHENFGKHIFRNKSGGLTYLSDEELKSELQNQENPHDKPI